MAGTYICNGTKYEVGGPNRDTIGLPVFIQNLPQRLNIEGLELQAKPAFHVSLVCIGKIIEKQGIAIPDLVNKVIDDFCSYTKNNEIGLIKYGEFRFVSQNERRTVVAMCEVSNLEGFFDLINKKYDLKAEYPPTHVTLYTLQPNLGIFLVDSNDIANLTKIIPKPEGISL